jgi:hypothetical protein
MWKKLLTTRGCEGCLRWQRCNCILLLKNTRPLLWTGYHIARGLLSSASSVWASHRHNILHVGLQHCYIISKHNLWLPKKLCISYFPIPPVSKASCVPSWKGEEVFSGFLEVGWDWLHFTSASNWSIVPAPDDRWMWSSQWNENWQGKPK